MTTTCVETFIPYITVTVPAPNLTAADVCLPCIFLLTCNGKAVPLQAWSGPGGYRKFRFPDLVTTAKDGGKVVGLTHWPPLPPGNTPVTHFCKRPS